MSTIEQDNHVSQCKNNEYFFCEPCNELVHETAPNVCPGCQKYISRMRDCICELLGERSQT
jgi:rubrerythrin